MEREKWKSKESPHADDRGKEARAELRRMRKELLRMIVRNESRYANQHCRPNC